jgi:hypothetical protein
MIRKNENDNEKMIKAIVEFGKVYWKSMQFKKCFNKQLEAD